MSSEVDPSAGGESPEWAPGGVSEEAVNSQEAFGVFDWPATGAEVCPARRSRQGT